MCWCRRCSREGRNGRRCIAQRYIQRLHQPLIVHSMWLLHPEVHVPVGLAIEFEGEAPRARHLVQLRLSWEDDDVVLRGTGVADEPHQVRQLVRCLDDAKHAFASIRPGWMEGSKQ